MPTWFTTHNLATTFKRFTIRHYLKKIFLIFLQPNVEISANGITPGDVMNWAEQV